MKRDHLLSVLGLFLGCVFGCDADAPTPPQLPNEPVYHQPTAPESLIANLELSHTQRQLGPYLQLLGPEFRFQLWSESEEELSILDRNRDSTGTQAFLASPQISKIRIELITQAPDTTINFPGTPLDTLKMQVTPRVFEVSQTDGVTWAIATQQVFFFRKGLASQGENPNHWLIYFWVELKNASRAASAPTPVQPNTWFTMKTFYVT